MTKWYPPVQHTSSCDVIVALRTDQTLPVKRMAKRQRSQPLKSGLTPIRRSVRPRSSSAGPSTIAIPNEFIARWMCHKAVLARSSYYFHGMFQDQFHESKSAIVSLPRSVFGIASLNCIFHFMYTQTLELPTNQQLALELLQEVYSGADYLGMTELCKMIGQQWDQLVHQWTCYCASCQTLVPQLLAFSQYRLEEEDKSDNIMAKISQDAQVILTCDPDKSLQSFWTSRDMAQLPNLQTLSPLILNKIGKCNAIESLYACYIASQKLAESDPLLSWSHSLHATLASAQSRATHIIAKNFNFYCSQYPALMSCIDGITYSVDFLEYLLLQVLEDQMDSDNAGLLYQGIVRDLMCRHTVQINPEVKYVLIIAREMAIRYIGRQLDQIREKGNLNKLDATTVRMLAEDLFMNPAALLGPRKSRKQRILAFLKPSDPRITMRVSRHPSQQTTTTTGSRARTIESFHSCKDSLCGFMKKIWRYRKKRYPDTRLSGRRSAVMADGRNSSRLMATRHYSHISTYSSINERTLIGEADLRLERKLSSSSYSHMLWPGPTPTKRTLAEKLLPSLLFPKISMRHTHSLKLSMMITVGKRVQLIRRPVLTVGTVAYIGHVVFAEGIWVGVELDRRVGKNDGSIDGHRYFKTSPNRGIFVRMEDVSVIV
ncbi:uncharacterized protein BYT42DRAFT_611500 [Radiomyces spectabilis]|uniref:uncharacterized protein n=1 Tax=Radiomyces spectabilis TaxID=64574 RepID=UPI0022202242|nr:uncharacterized protein BYT42DRAFT_611500 [Radiomyces spectabilis]KAI8388461.1 hypothetical protein BYT42DRAFT_611500 [Radiomyces spectabilis]